ncbi:hypothetical protein SESBI_06887 [Sesbania bispinosa]|nr:hypothetical protein SESBI_06887 [Sesbania bispinosa]
MTRWWCGDGGNAAACEGNNASVPAFWRDRERWWLYGDSERWPRRGQAAGGSQASIDRTASDGSRRGMNGDAAAG